MQRHWPTFIMNIIFTNSKIFTPEWMSSSCKIWSTRQEPKRCDLAEGWTTPRIPFRSCEISLCRSNSLATPTINTYCCAARRNIASWSSCRWASCKIGNKMCLMFFFKIWCFCDIFTNRCPTDAEQIQIQAPNRKKKKQNLTFQHVILYYYISGISPESDISNNNVQ